MPDMTQPPLAWRTVTLDADIPLVNGRRCNCLLLPADGALAIVDQTDTAITLPAVAKGYFIGSPKRVASSGTTVAGAIVAGYPAV